MGHGCDGYCMESLGEIFLRQISLFEVFVVTYSLVCHGGV